MITWLTREKMGKAICRKKRKIPRRSPHLKVDGVAGLLQQLVLGPDILGKRHVLTAQLVKLGLVYLHRRRRVGATHGVRDALR